MKKLLSLLTVWVTVSINGMNHTQIVPVEKQPKTITDVAVKSAFPSKELKDLQLFNKQVAVCTTAQSSIFGSSVTVELFTIKKYDSSNRPIFNHTSFYIFDCNQKTLNDAQKKIDTFRTYAKSIKF